MLKVAKTALVEKGAELGADVEVGEFALVRRGAVLGDRVSIGAHSVVCGGTVIGAGSRIFSHCSMGAEPQDKKYKGEETRLVLGENNVVREFCFFNRGTAAGGETRVGDGNWIMAYVHLAHDCVLGDDATVANAAQIAGHAEIGDGAVLGGGVLVHQFSRVGRGAMIGGGEKIRMDIPPYALLAEGRVGVNAEGMRRAGFSESDIAEVKAAFRDLYRAGLSLDQAREKIRKSAGDMKKKSGKGGRALSALAEFLSVPGRGIVRPSRRN